MSVFHNISSYLYSANSREKVERTASFFCARISTCMANQDQHNITGMLAAWNGGDADALDRLIDLVYPELRRIARQYLEHRRPGESLESAALANEAYLKLVRSGGIRCESRAHFLGLCSQIIRRILVDHARRRGAKRGGAAVHVPLDEVLVAAETPDIDVLALNEALNSLGRIDPRKCRVVELRYFGGLTIEEAAEILNISVDTAKRDWRMAKAWLLAELSGEGESAKL
jgi:RNA polymerase sigma-70 factor (ECF subfamily)